MKNISFYFSILLISFLSVSPVEASFFNKLKAKVTGKPAPGATQPAPAGGQAPAGAQDPAAKQGFFSRMKAKAAGGAAVVGATGVAGTVLGGNPQLPGQLQQQNQPQQPYPGQNIAPGGAQGQGAQGAAPMQGPALLQNPGQYMFGRLGDKLQIFKTKTIAVPVEYELDRADKSKVDENYVGVSRIIKAFDPSTNRTSRLAESVISVPISELIELRKQLGYKTGVPYKSEDLGKSPAWDRPKAEQTLSTLKNFFAQAFGYLPMGLDRSLILLDDRDVDETNTVRNRDDYEPKVLLHRVYIPLDKKMGALNKSGDASVDLNLLVSARRADLDGLNPNAREEFIEIQSKMDQYKFSPEARIKAEGWLKSFYAAYKGIKTDDDHDGIKKHAFEDHTTKQVEDIAHKIMAYFNRPDKHNAESDHPNPIEEKKEDGWSNFIAAFNDKLDRREICTKDNRVPCAIDNSPSQVQAGGLATNQTTTQPPSPYIQPGQGSGGVAQMGVGSAGPQAAATQPTSPQVPGIQTGVGQATATSMTGQTAGGTAQLGAQAAPTQPFPQQVPGMQPGAGQPTTTTATHTAGGTGQMGGGNAVAPQATNQPFPQQVPGMQTGVGQATTTASMMGQTVSGTAQGQVAAR